MLDSLLHDNDTLHVELENVCAFKAYTEPGRK